MLRLASDDPDESTTDVSISGNGLMPPDIDLVSMPPHYGEVVVGTMASQPFVIRNLGDVELEVAAALVDAPPGEFAIVQGSAPFTVMPGAIYSLDIQFVPSSGGPKTATLRLSSNDRDEETTDVAITGHGLMPPDIDLVPTPPDYGQVLVGTTTSRTFVVRNLGDVALLAGATVVNGDATEFAVAPASASFTVFPGASHSVEVTFAPTTGGPKASTLRLTSDDADEGNLDVALSGIGLMPADIDVGATTRDYGQVVVGTMTSQTIVIQNLGDVALQVSGATLVNVVGGEFVISEGGAPFEIAAGAAHTMYVRFAPASGGVKTTTLRILSDDADEGTADVSLSGIGLMPADIELASTSHDYGAIVVGTSASHTIIVRNLGDVDLHVTAATLVNGQASDFAITQGNAPFTVAPSASHTINLQFSPVSNGAKTTNLRLLSDDADETSVDVVLSGIGLMPPDIDLGSTTHDYGQVVVGNAISHTVDIRNLGDVALQVTEATFISGDIAQFAIVEVGAPFTVAPGDTHPVNVRFAPVSGGVKTVTLRLVSDDADEAAVDVTLSGKGLMPADIDLNAITHDYGQVTVGTSSSHAVIIRNLGDLPLQVAAMTFISGNTGEFSLVQGAPPPFTVGPGTQHVVDVRFAPGSAGQKTTTLRLVSDDQDEGTVDIVVNGRGMMPPDIDLSPVAFDYGQATVGTAASRTFLIGNLGDLDLHVTAPSIVGGEATEFVLGAATGFSVTPGAAHSLEIRFVPTSGGPKHATLRLVSDDPNESLVEVPLSGVGMMPPDIDVAPVTQNYGDVLVGTAASRTLAVRNLGDIELRVTAASLVGSEVGEFAITQGGAPFVVAPGATHNVDVRFSPTSGGPKTATLRLASDDSDESAIDVTLSGTATTAPEVDVVLTPIQYGETLVGASSSRALAVRNAGSADLHATASLVGAQAGEFSVLQTTSFTVAPGATHTVDLRFVPTSGGPKETTFRLTSDDVDEATIEVPLSGIGMMPADIDVAPAAHDYSDVLLGTTAARTFAIRNLGDVNLQVNLANLVGGEAGEFSMTQGSAPFSVAPGMTHNLEVRFAPVSAGQKTTHLHLASDDQDESVLNVLLTGTATTAPEFEASTTAQTYGVVWVGASAVRTFVIRNVGSADLQILTTTLDGDAAGEFTIVQGAAPVTVAPGATHNVDVRFVPALVGTRTAMIHLTSNDLDESTVDFTLGGTGIMPPDIDVTPLQNDFGEVVIGMMKSRTLAIRNSGGANLQVTAATLTGENAAEFGIAQGAAPFTVAAGTMHNLVVHLAPSTEGLKTAVLRLATDDPDEGMVDVSLSGSATALVPDIAVLPESHDYGSLTVGTAVIQSFIVNNTGTKNLVVGSSTLSGPDAQSFAVVNTQAGFTLAPGTSRVIDIRFSPVTAGPKSATLTIASDDPDENPVVIPVRGTTPPTFMEAQEGGSSSTNIVTTATSLTGVSGHLYLTAVSTKPYREVSSVTGLGLSWTPVTTQCAGRSQTGIELWWAQGTASTGQVTATLVSAPNNAVIAVARYAGVSVDPVEHLVAGNTNGVNGGCGNATDTPSYAFNVTPTQSASLVFGAVALRSKTIDSTSGYTTRFEVSHGTGGNVAGIALVDRVTPAAAVLPLSGSLSGAVDWALIGIEVRRGP
jgi:hypothetical protein